MRPALIGLSLALLLPMSTLTVAQEGVANTYFYNKSTSAVIYRVTGQWRPNLADAIDITLKEYPEINRAEYLAVLMQESDFNTMLIQKGDYGAAQVHLEFWKDKYRLDENNIMDVKVNCYVSADIIANYAMDKQGHINYGRYCGTQKNVKYYKKKLKIIKGMV